MPVSVTVDSGVSLAVTKRVGQSHVDAGATVTYTIDFENRGTGDATNVTLSDPLPADVSFVSASDGGTESAGTVNWSIGLLGAGQRGSRTLTVRADSPLANGTIIGNQAVLGADNESPVTSPSAKMFSNLVCCKLC